MFSASECYSMTLYKIGKFLKLGFDAVLSNNSQQKSDVFFRLDSHLRARFPCGNRAVNSCQNRTYAHMRFWSDFLTCTIIVHAAILKQTCESCIANLQVWMVWLENNSSIFLWFLHWRICTEIVGETLKSEWALIFPNLLSIWTGLC